MIAGTPTIAGVAGMRRPVVDLARSVDFYRGALGFENVDSAHAPTAAKRQCMRLGAEWIELVEVDANRMPAPASIPDPRFQHAAIVARDVDAAWRRLTAFEPMLVPITTGGPQRLPARSGGATAFKFRDPDGHPLELIEFAAGEASARWAQPTTSITLGIDHFAIVVADADRSIAFYEARGFRLRGQQVNRGAEQARLDGAAIAVVEVVALELPSSPTPHLELLCYRQPAPQTVASLEPRMATDALALASSAGEPTGATFVDPDGHRFATSPSASA